MEQKKQYNIIWSPSFFHELRSICNYLLYNLKNSSISSKFRNKVIKKIYSLKHSPERFTRLNFKQNIRKITIDNYIVIYEVKYHKRWGNYFTHISFQTRLF